MTAQKMSITALFAGLFATTAAQAASPAAGWQRVVDQKNHCRMDVPANWGNSMKNMKWFPKSPDHSASAAITTSRVKSMDLAHQQVMSMKQQGADILEDSAQRLWYAGKDGDDTTWGVLVPGSGVICHADVNFKHAADAGVVRQIALSVAPLP